MSESKQEITPTPPTKKIRVTNQLSLMDRIPFAVQEHAMLDLFSTQDLHQFGQTSKYNQHLVDRKLSNRTLDESKARKMWRQYVENPAKNDTDMVAIIMKTPESKTWDHIKLLDFYVKLKPSFDPEKERPLLYHSILSNAQFLKSATLKEWHHVIYFSNHPSATHDDEKNSWLRDKEFLEHQVYSFLNESSLSEEAKNSTLKRLFHFTEPNIWQIYHMMETMPVKSIMESNLSESAKNFIALKRYQIVGPNAWKVLYSYDRHWISNGSLDMFPKEISKLETEQLVNYAKQLGELKVKEMTKHKDENQENEIRRQVRILILEDQFRIVQDELRDRMSTSSD